MKGIDLEVLKSLDLAVFGREDLGFQSDETQEGILGYDGRRLILNCCRQFGKSTLAAITCLHRIVYFPGSLVLLISASFRQSQELFKKVAQFSSGLINLPEKLTDNKLSMDLKNGSRVVSLPSKEGTLRGYSNVDLICMDEAARVDDSVYRALRPMLAVSGGKLILLSTPNGKRGFFYQEWKNGTGWGKIKVTADKCDRISEEFLREERRSLGAYWYAQEYDCVFQETIGQLFDYHTINKMFDRDVELLFQEREESKECISTIWE